MRSFRNEKHDNVFFDVSGCIFIAHLWHVVMVVLYDNDEVPYFIRKALEHR